MNCNGFVWDWKTFGFLKSWALEMTKSYFEYQMKGLAPTSYSGAKYFTTFNAKLVSMIKLLALKEMNYLLQIEPWQMNKYKIQSAH